MSAGKYMERVRAIIGDCTCHDGFKRRNQIDPECAWHDHGEDIAALCAEIEAETIERCACIAEDEAEYGVSGRQIAAAIRAGKP